jgi:hypothetical protein
VFGGWAVRWLMVVCRVLLMVVEGCCPLLLLVVVDLDGCGCGFGYGAGFWFWFWFLF